MQPFITTSSVLVETSAGPLVMDLYGGDAPALTASFLNLCRCKAWTGARATAIIPSTLIIFEAPYPSTHNNHSWSDFVSLVACDGGASTPTVEAYRHRAMMESSSTKQRRCIGPVNVKTRTSSSLSSSNTMEEHGCRFLRAPPAECPGFVGRRATLIVPTARGSSSSPSSWRFGIVLADADLDYLAGEYVCIGEVAPESANVLRRMRASPHSGDAPQGSTWPRPLRLVRVKHATMLATAGTEAFVAPRPRNDVDDDAWSYTMISKKDASSSSTSVAVKSGFGKTLATMGAFALMASNTSVCAANRALMKWISNNRNNMKEGESCGLLPMNTTRLYDDEVCSIDYDEHFSGGFLSSDDDDDDHDGDARGTLSDGMKAREARRHAAQQLHEQKANTTYNLMLHVLNGVADPSDEIHPPDNVLFVCKLNPITTSEGLALCFSQFGEVKSVDVLRDAHSQQSLCYGFVEFVTTDACYRAFLKMDAALVDDSRIHVDYSQSVAKLWAKRRREMTMQHHQQHPRKRERDEGGRQ